MGSAGFPSADPHDVIIIGAGFGGIGMAIRLKQAGRNDFVVLDQASEIGGTWRDNTYPGCACDIPALLYSFSFASGFDWSRRYPTREEIHAYLLECVAAFGIRPHLRLGTRLLEATHADGRWHLLTDRGTMTARALILATGALHHPAIPDIPGLESFAGPRMHTARWDPDIHLSGKRVAVIGTGASAVQLVPPLAEQAAELILLQRTPAWVLPKRDPPSSGAWRLALRHLPGLRRLARTWEFWSHECRALGFVRLPALMRAAERRARSHAKRQIADPVLRARMTPDYSIGCKRVLLSNDFLPALNSSRVRVVTSAIARVTRNGIETADGASHAADVLILATGFQATNPLGSVRIVGRDGRSLSEAWAEGMRAWMGIAVPGFPNLFLMGGPHSGLGHNSVVFMLEAQANHILKRLDQAEVEIRPEPDRRFQDWLDRRMRRTVWLSGCRSWYLDRRGRNTTLWPSFCVSYWLRLRLDGGRSWTSRR